VFVDCKTNIQMCKNKKNNQKSLSLCTSSLFFFLFRKIIKKNIKQKYS
jgi:hypothetical protein